MKTNGDGVDNEKDLVDWNYNKHSAISASLERHQIGVKYLQPSKLSSIEREILELQDQVQNIRLKITMMSTGKTSRRNTFLDEVDKFLTELSYAMNKLHRLM